MDVVFDFCFSCLFTPFNRVESSHTLYFNKVMNQFLAARHGDLQQLRVALTVDNVNDVDGDGWTALLYAAYGAAYGAYSHGDCVKHCIEMGANVNAHNANGYAPLHFAASIGQVDIARMLLDAGAMVDVTSGNGWTPLNRAIHYKHVDVALLLMDWGAKVSNVTLALENYLPAATPNWFTNFFESRSKCRYVAIIMIGMRKYRRTTMTGNNDINVIRFVAKHIWSTRMDNVWVTPAIETCSSMLQRV
jgi:hypothetical protein